MSDGITDSYRDQEREERYGDFLVSLANYLENKTPKILRALNAAASAVDDMPRGLMIGQTNLAQDLDLMTTRLIENDQRTWGQLLSTALGRYPGKVYKRLKKLSPFAGKILIEVDYGCGFVNLRGEIRPALDQIIQNVSNLKIYDADKYIVAIPESALAQAKVTWLHCGYFAIKEPRKARHK